MARVFITGSADGLGRATAQTLLGDGHEVIVHARSAERLTAVNDLIGRGASAVVGDLADLTRHGLWPTSSTSSAGLTR
jgi:NAD(P)-dependent dehydrogenase (short-subunit alcohol dehydrogenase family)